MIRFKEIEIDEDEFFIKTSNSFKECAKYLLAENQKEFIAFFKDYSINQLVCAQSSISYRKNFEIEDLFYFEQSTEFHIYSSVYVFALDEDSDKELLCHYTLIFNERLEIVDDFLNAAHV